jgi:hypothetical protein
MAKKRKKKNNESGTALPERLALTTLLDPTSLLGGTVGTTGGLPDPGQAIPPTSADDTTGGSDPLGGAMNNIGAVAGQAQQTGPGATAENVESDGSTSTSSTSSSP